MLGYGTYSPTTDATQVKCTFLPVIEMDAHALQYWMTRFILEVQKKKGEKYPPNTLHHLACGIMRFLQ